MLSEALSYPTEDDDWLGPFLIGSGLLLASLFVGLTVIPLYGYLLQVLDAGRFGSRELPAFDDWETLIVDGIKMFGVNFVYAGIPGLLFFGAGFFTLLGLGVGASAESGGAALVALVFGGLVTFLAGLLWLAATVLVPAALGHMRAEDDFAAAFRVRTVVDIAIDRDYLVAVTLAWVVGSVISTVGSLLSIVLVGLPVLLFGSIVTFYLFGQGYQRAREASGRRGDPAGRVQPGTV